MFRLNGLALIFIALGAVVGLGLDTLIGNGNVAINGLIAGIVITLLDLGYRAYKPAATLREKWFSLHHGAALAFFPGWILGILISLIGFFPQ